MYQQLLLYFYTQLRIFGLFVCTVIFPDSEVALFFLTSMQLFSGTAVKSEMYF